MVNAGCCALVYLEFWNVEFEVGRKVVLFRRQVVEDIPGLLTGLLTRGANQPELRHLLQLQLLAVY